MARAHLDVLRLPENARYRAYAAPNNEPRGGRTGTHAGVCRIYPYAFSVISVPGGPVDARRAELIESVRRGDILHFRAWFDDEHDAKVKRIYQEAGRT